MAAHAGIEQAVASYARCEPCEDAIVAAQCPRSRLTCKSIIPTRVPSSNIATISAGTREAAARSSCDHFSNARASRHCHGPARRLKP